MAIAPSIDDLFKPLLPPPMNSTIYDLIERSTSPPDSDSLALVDWRWARAWGFFDAKTREWVEAMGGLGGYLDEKRRRADVKRAKANRGATSGNGGK